MFTKYLFSFKTNNFSPLWKAVDSVKLLSASEKLTAIPNLEVVRYRARRGTREAALKAKKARKLQNATKPAPIPKYLQRKIKVSVDLERKRCTDENWLQEQPIDNVWNMKLYRGKPYSVSEAVDILKGMHIPSLLNDPSAMLYITIELDLKLKKKNKFLDDFNGVTTFPYEFETYKTNRVIAICKADADQVKATEAGALYSGSSALIKQILSGALTNEDFDYIICHPDMYKELNTLRGILKRKYPTAHNGLLRIDVDRAVATFIKGIEYTMKRSTVEPDFGWVDICCGRLNMPVEQIEENVKHALNAIEKYKPTGTNHILFIIRALLWCEKSRERIKIPHWDYLKNYPKNGILIEESDENNEHVEAN